jgi:ribulose-phosphate 3-epimerase
MADVTPSITATYSEEYNRQIERIAPFATRIHIDISDGIFTPNKLIDANEVWWPGGIRADVHVMYKRPVEVIDAVIALAPQLVILHAESEGDFMYLAKQLHFHGIEAGIALLPGTPVEFIRPGIDVIDHVLIFSGDPGHYGGHANLDLLEKVKAVREMSKRVEIGWDGGVSDQNIKPLVDGGVEVAVSGGYILKAPKPLDAYEQLVASIK